MINRDRIMDIRYGKIPSHEIFNMIGFEGKIINNLLDLSADELIYRRTRARELQVLLTNRIDNYYKKLEHNILNQGIRNPILITAGKPRNSEIIPSLEKIINPDPVNWLLAEHYCGSSRLIIAQKYDLDIPCIIIDKVNRFSDYLQIKSKGQALRCFLDEPVRFTFSLTNKEPISWRWVSNPQVIDRHQTNTYNRIVFNTKEDLEILYDLHKLLGGTTTLPSNGVGFWAFADRELIKELYPDIHSAILIKETSARRNTPEPITRSKALLNNISNKTINTLPKNMGSSALRKYDNSQQKQYPNKPVSRLPVRGRIAPIKKR